MNKVKDFLYQLLTTWIEFFNFLKSPNPYRQHIKIEKKLLAIFSLLILDLLFNLSVQSFIDFLINLKLIPNPGQNTLNKTLNSNQILKSLLTVVLVTPFLEELIFRWQLRKVYATAWFFIIVFLAAGYKFFDGKVVAVIAALLLIIMFLFSKYSFRKRYHIWRFNYGIIFYFTACAFAVAHISNYKTFSNSLIWCPLYVLPQLFGATFLGYSRIKYGFWYGLLLHVLFNLVAFTGYMLSK